MLLLWPGEVRRKREEDFGRIGPVLFAGTNISDLSIKKISSTSYLNVNSIPKDLEGHFEQKVTTNVGVNMRFQLL